MTDDYPIPLGITPNQWALALTIIILAQLALVHSYATSSQPLYATLNALTATTIGYAIGHTIATTH